jgi:FtsZ-binding cell division protein ZapB
VAGPELVRITSKFEASMEGLHQRTSITKHHDQTKSTQVMFAQHVRSLVEVMEEMGNPFLEESKDLLRLDTRDIVDTIQLWHLQFARLKR